jgi:hypothetical protein
MNDSLEQEEVHARQEPAALRLVKRCVSHVIHMLTLWWLLL